MCPWAAFGSVVAYPHNFVEPEKRRRSQHRGRRRLLVGGGRLGDILGRRHRATGRPDPSTSRILYHARHSLSSDLHRTQYVLYVEYKPCHDVTATNIFRFTVN